MGFDHGLKPGDIINNQKLADIFKIRGMRRSLTTNTLILVSDYTRRIYNDRWVNDVLHYTGMGLEGDQRIDASQNRTLAESNENGVEVFLFEVFESGKYIFQGQVKLANNPYQEKQLDNAYSGDLGRLNRRKSAACSGASRPPKPEQSGHRSERSDAGFKYVSNF